MTGALYRLARFCARHRFLVLSLWLIVTVVLVAVSHQLGDNTNDNLTLPGTGSQHATDTLSKSFPDQANGSSPIVLHVTSGKLTDSKYSSAVNQAAADVAKAPYVASVVNPLTPQGASALSKDQATGYLSVTLSVSPGSAVGDDAQTIINAAAKPAQAAGIQVETGGQLGQKVSKPVHRVQRADRDHRGDGDPHVHVRHRGVDAAADPDRDPRRWPRRCRSSRSSAT